MKKILIIYIIVYYNIYISHSYLCFITKLRDNKLYKTYFWKFETKYLIAQIKRFKGGKIMDTFLMLVGFLLNVTSLVMLFINYYIKDKSSKIPWIIMLTGWVLTFIGLDIHHR